MASTKGGKRTRRAARLIAAAAAFASILILFYFGTERFYGAADYRMLYAADGGAGRLPGPDAAGAADARSVNVQPLQPGESDGGQAVPSVPKPQVTVPSTQGAGTSSAKAAAANTGAAPSPGIETAKAEAGKASPGSSGIKAAVKINTAPKTVYLTFDDGPSSVTPKVLDILRRAGVKATFFVLGEGAESHPELINQIWEQGHAIGNHTYNHNYKDLYSGFTRFWSQIKQTEDIVRQITGVRPRLVRAPGGTAGHFDDTYFTLMKQAGYTVTDWTADSGDSKRKGVPAAEIVKESVSDLRSPAVVLLLHDGAGHAESAKALPEIIERYKAAGYVFKTLDAGEPPVQFKVRLNSRTDGRVRPLQAWIDDNIAANASLFGPGQPLVVEAGGLQTSLEPGEYEIRNGQYLVPLRTVVERLGGSVSWDPGTRSGTARLNGRAVLASTADAEAGEPVSGGASGIRQSVTLRAGAIWLPLRDLLQSAGYSRVTADAGPEERRVKAY